MSAVTKIKEAIKASVCPSLNHLPRYGITMTHLYKYELNKTKVDKVVDIFYYAVECAFNYLNTIGDMDESYYDDYMNLFEEFTARLNKLEDNNKKSQIKTKVKKIIDSTNMGYGIGDFMEECNNNVL